MAAPLKFRLALKDSSVALTHIGLFNGADTRSQCLGRCTHQHRATVSDGRDSLFDSVIRAQPH